MPRTKPKPEPTPEQPPAPLPPPNGPLPEVMTLAEAAAYLRLPETEVLHAVREQDLPARQLGTEWRFFKNAIQGWLSTSGPKGKQEGIWSFAGAWKDDPHVEEMLQEIYRQRGRPMTEEK